MPKTPSKSTTSKTTKPKAAPAPKVKKIEDIDGAFAQFVKDNKLSFTSTHDKGVAFEKFCLVLIQAAGYDVVKSETRSSNDKGIDMIVSKTRTISSGSALVDDEKVKTVFAVQCKYKGSGNIGPAIVRDLIGSLDGLKRYKNKKGILITNADFTYDAKELESTKILLVSGENLFQWYQKAKKKGLL